LEKIEYFNTGFIFYNVNILPDIMQNWYKNIWENHPFFKGFLKKKLEFFFCFFSKYYNILLYIKKLYRLGQAQPQKRSGRFRPQMVGPISAPHLFIYFFGVGPDLAQKFRLGHIRPDPTSIAWAVDVNYNSRPMFMWTVGHEL
jgi:hypothetical protein